MKTVSKIEKLCNRLSPQELRIVILRLAEVKLMGAWFYINRKE